MSEVRSMATIRRAASGAVPVRRAPERLGDRGRVEGEVLRGGPPARADGAHVRTRLDETDRPHHAAPASPGQALDQQRQLRGRGTTSRGSAIGIGHPRGRAAPDRRGSGSIAAMASHDAKRQARPVEGDGLLDVELEVPGQIPGRPPGRVERGPAAAHGVDRPGEAPALPVAEAGGRGGVELAAHGPAPDGREPEVGRLLAGEVDDLERVPEPVAARVEAAGDFEARPARRRSRQPPPASTVSGASRSRTET
jgi:hypothetical protein